MKHRILITLIGALASFQLHAQGAPAPAGDLPQGWLVTGEEVSAFQGAEGFDAPLPLRTRALVPSIDILQPQATSDLVVKAPFPIAIRFKARDDAAIVPSTFRVLYGALRVDITNRITKFVKPTAEGLSFDKAQIPAGKHRLVMVVEDEKQRVAERELRIQVE